MVLRAACTSPVRNGKQGPRAAHGADAGQDSPASRDPCRLESVSLSARASMAGRRRPLLHASRKGILVLLVAASCGPSGAGSSTGGATSASGTSTSGATTTAGTGGSSSVGTEGSCDFGADAEVEESQFWVTNLRDTEVYMEVLEPCQHAWARVYGPEPAVPLRWASPDCWTCDDALDADCDCEPPQCWSQDRLVRFGSGGEISMPFWFRRHVDATIPDACPIATGCERECFRVEAAPPGGYEFKIRISSTADCPGGCDCQISGDDGFCWDSGVLTGEVEELSGFVDFPKEMYPEIRIE